ncbi:MAG: peroxiredoxin family protein, partial [Anaerolineae bacterium]
MKQNHVRLWIGSLILLLILTACSSSTPPAASTNNDGGSGGDVQVAEDIDAGRGEDAVVEDAGIEETTVSPDTTNETGPKTAAADRPAWQTVPLTDVRTGETFTLADYAGKVIIVETMAVWCPFCDQQQMQINS